MNKVSKIIIGTFILLSISFFTMAAYTGPQGQNKVSVKQLSSQADDSWVTLEGKLISHLGGDRYVFRDVSGEVNVEVDQDTWRGITIGPDDLIRIQGKVDRGMYKTEVEVKVLDKVVGNQQTKGGFNANQ